MESIEQIKLTLTKQPLKCIQILSSHKFMNNVNNEHLTSLVQIIESALQQAEKKNQRISFKNSQAPEQQELNYQVILSIYSIIIMKSLKHVSSEDHLIFNSKLAIQTLLKMHKQSSDEIKKLITGLLLKIPSFSNYKAIARDIDMQFISLKTMKKHNLKLRQQCPNIYQEKLQQNKHTQWAQFLSYKPFSLKLLSGLMSKLNQPQSLNNADLVIEVRENIRIQAQYLIQRAKRLGNQQFQIHEFCSEYQKLFHFQIQQVQAQVRHFKKGNNYNSIQSSSSALQLRLKVLLQSKNYLLKILINLAKKLNTFWFRKIKWLFQFVNQSILNFRIQQGLQKIQIGQLWHLKKIQLKNIIQLLHTYYKTFGDGLFMEDKLKSILFTQQYSVYKLVQALLYNQYDFVFTSDKNRIVNYQKSKKVTEQSKIKDSIIRTVNVNSKSLNINLHYDIVFQKMIVGLSLAEGQAYSHIRELINECLQLYITYYQKSQTYFYGGNVLSMIQNCKNSNLIKQNSKILIQKIKSVLYPDRKMIKQGLEYFCQEVFYNYISANKQKSKKIKNSDNFSLCQNQFVHIIGSQKQSFQESKLFQRQSQRVIREEGTSNRVIRKTKSYDMVIEGWDSKDIKQGGNQTRNNLRNKQRKNINESQIFYSIKQQKSGINQGERQADFENNQNSQEDQMILTPEF